MGVFIKAIANTCTFKKGEFMKKVILMSALLILSLSSFAGPISSGGPQPHPDQYLMDARGLLLAAIDSIDAETPIASIETLPNGVFKINTQDGPFIRNNSQSVKFICGDEYTVQAEREVVETFDPNIPPEVRAQLPSGSISYEYSAEVTSETPHECK